MRVVLHHPQFQALESLWRGVDFLVRRLDTSESMQVYLVDVARDELSADLSADVGRTSLHALLADAPARRRASARGRCSSARTRSSPSTRACSRTLAALGRAAGAPWLAAAHPQFFGVESFAGADPDDWNLQRPSAWEGLRASAPRAVSRAGGAALPAPPSLRSSWRRVRIVRVRGARRELAGPRELPVGQSRTALRARDRGERGRTAIHRRSRATIERLPLYVAPVDGEPTATPCAETLLTQRAVEEMLDAGVTPLVSPRDGDTIVIPRIQSVAAPAPRVVGSNDDRADVDSRTHRRAAVGAAPTAPTVRWATEPFIMGSPGQFARLRDWLAGVGYTEPAICAAANVTSIGRLPTLDSGRAVFAKPADAQSLLVQLFLDAIAVPWETFARC